ncbi:hypothetical protein EVAR_90389_1 [Eumeta japonica]|uniref:Uncharacterized protein n=1 Tax=Eumeta variegata TaxID=151549 RepID=A0A4C1ZVL8_EUMVA|nr:hypothetical protein EVAR_90389_1 [Eumeta japonica]
MARWRAPRIWSPRALVSAPAARRRRPPPCADASLESRYRLNNKLLFVPGAGGRRPTRGRARSLRRRRQVETAVGARRGSTKPDTDRRVRTQVPTGSRRHAGDPRWRRSDRARLPIKLSTRRTAAARAVRTASRVLQPLSLALCRVDPVLTLDHHGRASPHMRSAPVGNRVVRGSVRGREEARNRLHTQPTAVGRCGRRRIEAARIGDLRWRRSNRADLADQAPVRRRTAARQYVSAKGVLLFFVLDHHPSSSSFFFFDSVFHLQSGAQATRGRARVSRACAQRLWGTGLLVVAEYGGYGLPPSSR